MGFSNLDAPLLPFDDSKSDSLARSLRVEHSTEARRHRRNAGGAVRRAKFSLNGEESRPSSNGTRCKKLACHFGRRI